MGGGDVVVADHVDLVDDEDVGRTQAEHVTHSRQCGDLVDVVAQSFEDGSTSIGALVAKRQPVLGEADGVEDDQRGPRVLGHVARRLRHELVREREPFGIDLMDERHVGDVRDPAPAGGRHDRRDATIEAAAKVSQAERTVVDGLGAHSAVRSIATPALGPGV